MTKVRMKRMYALLTAMFLLVFSITANVTAMDALASELPDMAPENTEQEVQAEPQTQTEDGVIAGWSFTTAPENGLPAAATTGSGTLSIEGAAYTGYSSKALAANTWTVGGGWVMEVDAAGYSGLTFSAQMRSSNTGPKNFNLQYSTNGTDWTVIDGSEGVIAGTGLAPVYTDMALPAALDNTAFKLRVTCADNVSLNNGTVAEGGASNINHIVLKGTGGGSEDTKETCAAVTASVLPGEVEAGTAVTLSCATEGAAISFNKDGSSNYQPYTEAIVITESTTIYAIASKEGYHNSAAASFAYTVKSGSEETFTGKKLNGLKNGDRLMIYNAANKAVMSSAASGKKLAGNTAEPSADGTLTAPEGAAVFTVSVDGNGNYSFVCDGKYLTSAATGNGLSLEAAAGDYSLWTPETADGGFYLKNVNASYNGSSQYIEYYSGFTTYGKGASANAAIYLLEFYGVSDGTGEPGEPEEPGKDVVVDATITANVAQWAGNANYEEAGVTPEGGIAGDIYTTNDMLDQAAIFTTVVGNAAVMPYTSGTSSTTGSTSYYMGGTGLGSGNGDYMQFALSSLGYGDMKMAFRLRASNTGAGAFQLQYSTDGTTFKNFKTGTYEYKYTAYVGGEPSEVSGSGDITDGIAKTSYAPGNYVTFTFDVPKAASNAEKLYVRMVPGTERASGSGAPSSGGTVRIDSVIISGHPVVSSEICGFVKAEPESGSVMLGAELTLTSTTEGAKIFYSVNGSEYKIYDADKKPVLDTLPADISTYASKDGLSDSIKTIYRYTQAQCATVKATPNGGSVAVGTRVSLTCETEGAAILYSSDDGANWEEYEASEKLVLNKLPAVYLVKAVKDGYKDSNPVTLSYTERENESYNIYFGQLHSHTSYSDGAGTCEEAYQHAANVKNLDFVSVTDHSNSFDNANNASISDGSVSEEWVEGHALADAYTTKDFVSIFGYEMTWSNGLGHINTFNSDGFQSRTQTDYSTYSTALQNYYAALKTEPDSISQFNHPGTTFGDFSDFAYYDAEIDDLITIIEVGNGEGAIGSSGYFPSYEYYQRALDKGWHVAPTNNQDNHKGLWGDANTARSVVLADSLTRENIYDAMRNYRIYATEDNDLSIYYTLDGYIMGSILSEGQTGEQVEIAVDLSDGSGDALGKVQVITNGGLVLAEKTVAGSEENVSFTVDNDYSYYYIKVVEADGDIAVTAPVWVGEVEAAGINSISTDEVLPVKNQALNVTLDLFNNEDTVMEIDSIEFSVKDEVVHTADLEQAGLKSIAAMSTGSYSFDYTYDGVGNVEVGATVNAKLNGAAKIYKAVLKLTYVSPEMVTKVIIDGTHYNDYVTGYYGGNVGNFTTIAGQKNVKVEVVTDEITPEMLDDCALLVISAPAKKTGTANAGDYVPSHFSDEFIEMVKNYTDQGGTLIACGIADYQDSADGQTTTEMNKLLLGIGATTTLYSDEAYDEDNNGGQPYRLYLKNTFNKDSKYLKGASEEQEYSAYSGCTVKLDAASVEAKTAEALIRGYDTTYSIDSKDEDGGRGDNSVVVEKGNVVVLAHETLESGADVFVAGTVFISDFEVKAELDNIWDLPYLNRTIAENILDDVTVELPVTPIEEVRKNGQMGDVFAIEGYVTAGTSVEGNIFFDTIYVQDDTAGITVFPYAEAGLEVGTKIRVTGYVDAYQGDKEIQIISSKVLSDETPKIYEPEKMTAAEAMDYEKSGGRLVRVEGKVVDVLYDAAGTGVSQFWLDDGSGTNANIFIDGYILSAKTGKNELASVVKKGDIVSAVGLVYAHPEGTSDQAVTCLRVRNCDEIEFVKSGETEKPDDGDKDDDDKDDDDKDNDNKDDNNTSGDNNGNNGSNGNNGNGGGNNGNVTQGSVIKNPVSSVTTAPKTGDQTPLAGLILLMFAGLLVVTYEVRHKMMH